MDEPHVFGMGKNLVPVAYL